MGERGKPIITAKGNGVMSQVYVLIDPRTDEVRYVGRTAMGLSIRLALRRFGLKSVSKTELAELALSECIPAEPTEELAAKVRARRVVLVNEGERP
jgi:hypothetical protein